MLRLQLGRMPKELVVGGNEGLTGVRIGRRGVPVPKMVIRPGREAICRNGTWKIKTRVDHGDVSEVVAFPTVAMQVVGGQEVQGRIARGEW